MKILNFFEEIEDVDFKVRNYTSLTGVWLLINFLSQLPVYFSLWGGADNLILNRELHGPRLPMLLDLLTHYPVFSPFVFILVILFSVLMIMGKTNFILRIATWYLVFLLDAKAWTVLDGGNNLIHLTLFYSIFFDFRLGDSETQSFLRKLSIRAIQVQIALVYGCAFFSKVGGELWQNGTALYYVVQVDKFQSASLMSLFKLFPVTVPLMVYATILIQLLLATLLWFKNWRLVAIVLGTIVHLGIAASMGLIAFSLVMIVHYSIFLSRDEVFMLKEVFQRHKKAAVALTVVFLGLSLGLKLKESEYFSPEVLNSLKKNLKQESRIFIVRSQTMKAEIIEKDSVQILEEEEWKKIELEYGSVTKLVTALKILEEENKGTIKRTNSVRLKDGSSVTIDDLLFHKSGIRDLNSDSYNVGNDKTVNYSNANYALAGQRLSLNDYRYSPSQNSSRLINISRRPQINDFYRPAFGIVGSAGELSAILKDRRILDLPCDENGYCWGGLKKNNQFISLGKLASGTTLASVDQDGDFIILSSNDHSIDLEKVLNLINE